MPPKRGRRRWDDLGPGPEGPALHYPVNEIGFDAPIMPAVQGHISSRRQYTYGAPIEPRQTPQVAWARVGNLGDAVNDALDEALPTTTSRTVTNKPRPQVGTGVYSEEDELTKSDVTPRKTSRTRSAASPGVTKKTKPSTHQSKPQLPESPEKDSVQEQQKRRRPPASMFPPQSEPNVNDRTSAKMLEIQSVDLDKRPVSSSGSNIDDNRSFVVESSVFGDASLRTTPAAPTNNPQNLPNKQAGIPPTSPSIRKQTQATNSAGSTHRPDIDSSNNTHGRSNSMFGPPRNIISNKENTEDTVDKNTTTTLQESADLTAETKPKRLAINNPASTRSQMQTGPASRPHDGQLSKISAPYKIVRDKSGGATIVAVPVTEPTNQLVRDKKGASKRGRGRQRRLKQGMSVYTDSSEEDEAPVLPPHPTSKFTSKTSLFARAKDFAGSRDPLSKPYPAPSDHSEQDDNLQRRIRAADQEAARKRQIRESRQRYQRWHQRWEQLKLTWPLCLVRPSGTPVSLDNVNLWLLLHPWTYIRAIGWAFTICGDRFIAILDYVFDQLYSLILAVASYAPHLVFALIMGFAAMSVAQGGLQDLTASMPDISHVHKTGASLMTGLGRVASGVGSFIPSISWPFDASWGEDIFPFEDGDDDNDSEVRDYLKRYSSELRKLKTASKLHEDSVKKLQTIVPKMVHMQLENSKPVIAEEFWHALRDLIHEDDTVLTFEKERGEIGLTSEQHWQHIAARLVKDPTFTSKLNMSISSAETRLTTKFSSYWENWIKNNDDKIARSLGSALEEVKSAGSLREFDERLQKAVKAQLDQQERKLDGVVVTRDEFLRHLKNEFASHRSEIRAEMSELQPQLERLVRQSVNMALKDVPQGMSAGQITTLVNGLVRKAIADMNLEAMAKGKIQIHYDMDLKNRINYFAAGNGATIDASLTSNTYVPTRQRPSTVRSFKRGWVDSEPPSAITTLDQRNSESDCWCAIRSINRRGNPHGAVLSVHLAYMVIPEYIVIEHILPQATVDPGARPKDIELYADITDLTVRERVRDFSSVLFPDDESDWNYMPADFPERFVKIGQFTYESSDSRSGRDVHQLSPELRALGAETDHIVVRATSNYGAQNHTCFYQVSVYGHNTENPALNGFESV